MKFRYLLIMLLLGVVSCQQPSSYWSTIQDVNNYIDVAPDSALTVLSSINSEDLNTEEEKATYALLLTMAQIKGGMIVYSDSLINEAVSFFSKQEMSSELMKSLFYKGDIAYNCNDLGEAIMTVTKSYEIANKLNDYYWIAKSAELISDIYTVSYNRDEILKYTIEAVENYENAGKRDNHLFSVCDLATAYVNNGDIDKGIELLDSVKNIAKTELRDSLLLAYCYRALFPVYVFSNNYEKARQCINELYFLSEYYTIPTKDIPYIAEIEMEKGNLDAAESLIKQADSILINPNDRVSVFFCIRKIIQTKGNV